jgi:hypothetical protein
MTQPETDHPHSMRSSVGVESSYCLLAGVESIGKHVHKLGIHVLIETLLELRAIELVLTLDDRQEFKSCGPLTANQVEPNSMGENDE